MEKRLIVAVVLSVVVIGAFKFLFPKPAPQIVATAPGVATGAPQERLLIEEPLREASPRLEEKFKEAVV